MKSLLISRESPGLILEQIHEHPQEKVNMAFDRSDTVEKMARMLSNTMTLTGDLIQIPPYAYRDFVRDYTPYRQPEPHYPHR
ncbi:MAG: hypothetical protein O3B73_07190 [bacterium]|nr:hypothetical protein [bacterium]